MTFRIIRLILIPAAVLLFIFSGLYYYLYTAPHGPSPDTIIFKIHRGENAREVAQNLKRRRIIKNKMVFLTAHRVFYSQESLKAGEYEITMPVSTQEILALIIKGKVRLYPVTIPEGLTLKETADLFFSLQMIQKEQFLSKTKDTTLIYSLDSEATDLEGYLFPETYHFPKGMTEDDIIFSMVEQFRKVFGETWQRRAAELGMSVREVVILASLIEKETSLAEERPLVSAVFHNRLRIRMKLDCDPTIIYALKLKDQFKGRLRTRDLKLDSPYNTYLYPGLPPGPIANPGKKSLEAALYPADVDYLYFVSKNDGSHHFSSDFKEHQYAVMKYQKNR